MSWLEAFIIGLLQGIAEFLPISSDGHIELGKAVLGIRNADNKLLTVVVHVATVLSTIIVFRKDIGQILTEVFRFRWSPTTRYVGLLLLSAVPVGLVGVFLKDYLDVLFATNLPLVGAMLLVTAALLMVTRFVPESDKPITPMRVIIMGIAQTLAILPGLSRSGSTISVALLMGIPRDQATRFSFLMVILPILGAGLLEAIDVMKDPAQATAIGFGPLTIAFVTSLVFGILACHTMLKFVQRSTLQWFALYCTIIGIITLIVAYS